MRGLGLARLTERLAAAGAGNEFASFVVEQALRPFKVVV
jgi:hypothetical protein